MDKVKLGCIIECPGLNSSCWEKVYCKEKIICTVKKKLIETEFKEA